MWSIKETVSAVTATSVKSQGMNKSEGIIIQQWQPSLNKQIHGQTFTTRELLNGYKLWSSGRLFHPDDVVSNWRLVFPFLAFLIL